MIQAILFLSLLAIAGLFARSINQGRFNGLSAVLLIAVMIAYTYLFTMPQIR